VIEWPAAGTTIECWCGQGATVPFRSAQGPADDRRPFAVCLAGHRTALSGRLVADPKEDPSGQSQVLIIRLGSSFADVKRQLFLATLQLHGWNVPHAAVAFGVSKPNLYAWVRTYRAEQLVRR